MNRFLLGGSPLRRSSLERPRRVGPVCKWCLAGMAVEEIYCKSVALGPRPYSVKEFACRSVPRWSLNPPRVATIKQDPDIHNGWEGACQGTSWRDIKRRAVFSFRQICSDSPTHMDGLRETSKVNTFGELREVWLSLRRETFSSPSSSSSSSPPPPETPATDLPEDSPLIYKPIIDHWDRFMLRVTDYRKVNCRLMIKTESALVREMRGSVI